MHIRRVRNRGSLRHVLSLEKVEERHCLSALTFVESAIACCSVPGASSSSIHAADLDGDGDLDAVLTSYNDDTIGWYENIDGAGRFEQRRVVAALEHVRSVIAVDLDRDGDLDLLSTSGGGLYYPGILSWHENTDGAGQFGGQQVIKNDMYRSIKSDVYGNLSSTTADLDGDGDFDVLLADCYDCSDPEITWYETTAEEGPGEEHKISATENVHGFFDFKSLAVADLDADGDVDVMSREPFGEIAWYENNNGTDTFSERQVIATEPGSRLSAADLDGDGDADVLTSSDNTIVWYENSDGEGNFGDRHEIANARGTAIAKDLDGDGDLDVLLASRMGLAWYENTDGLGHFSQQQVITTAQPTVALDVADMDADGDLDVLSVIRDGFLQLAWYENRLIGDSNDDGLFDSADLVQVFNTGKYESGSETHYDEGDWNQDGVFDSTDFVFALQSGNYVAAAEPGSIAISAAIDAAREFACVYSEEKGVNSIEEK